MKALEGFIIRNWFWIALGCVLQRKVIEALYMERGYQTVGGEWLVLPVVVMLAVFGRNIFWSIFDVMKMEDKDDTGIERNRRRIQK